MNRIGNSFKPLNVPIFPNSKLGVCKPAGPFNAGTFLNNKACSAQLSNLSDFLETDKGRVITELIAQGQFDQDVANAYRTRYFAPRRLAAREILQRGLDRGELKKEMDIELSIDLIFAPLFYRMLVTGDEIDSDFIKNVVVCILEGIKV